MMKTKDQQQKINDPPSIDNDQVTFWMRWTFQDSKFDENNSGPKCTPNVAGNDGDL